MKTPFVVISFLCCFMVGNQQKISQEILKRLSMVKTEEEFNRLFVAPEVNVTDTDGIAGNRTLVKKSRGQASVKTQNEIATPDACSVRPTTVMIQQPEDSNVIHWPTCTLIDRCGGCCSTDKYECVPSKTSPKFITVRVIRYEVEGSNFFNILGKKTIPMTQHESCEARCKIQNDDCTKQQKYNPDNCECECRTKPLSCGTKQRWDITRCQCVCRKIETCLAKEQFFSETTCQCEIRLHVSGIDINKISESKTGQTKIADSKMPDLPDGYETAKSKGSADDTKPIKITAPPYIPTTTKTPEKGKVDCSKMFCPPFFIGWSNSGVCECKPEWL